MVASLTALGRGAGACQARVSDCQARAVVWPHVLVTEHGRNRLLTLTSLSARYRHLLCLAARQELPVVSMCRWVCASVSGCYCHCHLLLKREKGRAEVMCQCV